MKITVRVCTNEGWRTHKGEAPEGSDTECLALHKGRCRSEFWSSHMSQDIPKGHALIWEVA